MKNGNISKNNKTNLLFSDKSIKKYQIMKEINSMIGGISGEPKKINLNSLAEKVKKNNHKKNPSDMAYLNLKSENSYYSRTISHDTHNQMLKEELMKFKEKIEIRFINSKINQNYSFPRILDQNNEGTNAINSIDSNLRKEEIIQKNSSKIITR